MGCCGSKKQSADVTAAASTQPTPKPAVVAETSGDFAQQLMDAQNVYRAKHGAPAFTLSAELCAGAKKWADNISSAGKLQHTSDRDVGENLAWSSGDMTAQAAADMWYNEIKDYNFSKPGFTGGTGHFTQVVWKSSTEFGAAIAHDSNGSAYVVGRYSPPGNISNPGYFEDNVKPAS